MKYKAIRDCTDYDGAFYHKVQVVELSAAARHSSHLTPMDETVVESQATKTKTTTKKRASKKAEA